MAAAEQSIQNKPGDPLGYYYKGVALGDLADEKPAGDRASQYKEMNNSFETAQTVADTVETDVSKQINNISSLKVNLWAKEYNKGIDYVTKDSVRNSVSNPQELAIKHLQNATIIIPDSARTWNVLSQIAYNADSLELAIDSKEEFFKRADNPSADDYTIIAAYYINNGNLDKAITKLQEGIEKYPDNVNITTTLADAYQRNGESEKSIGIVQDLVDQDPQNVKYRINLGSQIYQSALRKSEKASEYFDHIEELKAQQENVSGSQKEELQASIDELSKKRDSLLAESNSLTES
ncbi:MAG: tetratricopeptide repeat protein [Balneolaceae bacterium]|nr:tetratricopeptide repeat protein [Balneolaceae bacterium]